MGADYLLGVSEVWKLSTPEAGVLARVLLRRADKGDKAAIKTVSSIVENMDMMEAGLILLPRMGVTIKEVVTHGPRPRFIREKRSPE